MSEKLILSIDAGTSRIKAVLYTLDGREINTFWKDVSLITNSSFSEIDMEELWLDTVEVIRKAVSSLQDKEEIAALAVSGQGEGLWLLDKEGRPVSRAILWNDGRARELVSKLEKDTQLVGRLKSLTGSSPFTGATNVLLRWMKENDNETLERATYVLFCKDWLRYRLTGRIATDISDASTSLLDIASSAPSIEIFSLLGIEEYYSLLPEMLLPAEKAGNLTEKASLETGLVQGLPVAAGALDIVATALGCGAVETGDGCSILGTTGCNMILSPLFRPDPLSRAGSELHAVPGQTLTVSASMAATPNLDWIFKLFHKNRSYDDVEQELESVPVGCNGVMYHPYISSSGERAPFYSPSARAQFTGLTANVDSLILTRAVYEGVALSIKDCLEGRGIKRLFLGGGGGRSRFWAQVIADCLGVPVGVSSASELCARGSFLMAATAAGLFPDLPRAVKSLPEPEMVQPDNERNSFYEDLFSLYKEMREKMIPLWDHRETILQH